jgi:ABC-2 type transport system ATP-binding protein
LFGCLGPNGAGKTTAMKLAAGLVRPSSGVVTINGVDIQRDPIKAKHAIGFIPDSPYIYEALTGREFLHFCSGLFKMSGAETSSRVAELLDRFQIHEWIDRRAGQYSHGMKQRVVMASAFLHDPKVILIDEPMVGLDPAAMRLVKGILREFVESGGTVFLSTHTLVDAEELCDRVGIIHRGSMIACGTIDEVRQESRRLEDAFLSLTAGDNAL